ncbi:TonB family protein [Pelomonas sp. CA6]|uniref:energy transducer TonB n=1 Tax=Pelomonas sp. CA6 TaxID=2907999 RepID=UPI001F4BF5D9|nr:energy transducer TonB [Pelomonas sp. CA6]MCH7344324.1 TonB family protein [Pelomonas sp. CA6]
MAKLSTLHYALIASAALHAGLGMLRLVAPERFDRLFRDMPLEVVLVNARGNEPPAQAQALAQANLAGGGEAARADVRATSPLAPSPKPETGDNVELQRAQIAQLQAVQEQLLTQLRREVAKLPPPDPRRGDQESREQADKRRQLVQLLAEIEKRVNDENARPRKRYVSPATREVVYALYYESLRRRIEARGTRDFPTYKGRKLYGELVMNIHVDFNGRVVETDIVQRSGNPVLDRRAVAIVQSSAPFGSFTPEMRKGAEVLVITSRFRFTREDGLETTLSTAP